MTPRLSTVHGIVGSPYIMYDLLVHEKEVLGEACGIFAGCGSIYSTQRSHVVEIRGRREDGKYFESWVKPLIERIIEKKLNLCRRTFQGGDSICLRMCGKRPYWLFHVFLQFPIGKKSQSLRMPKLIYNNHEYWKAYIRGVFDSKGNVYLRKTGKIYKNPVIEISSPSIYHLIQLREILRDIGFEFWLERANLKIRIAGRKNAERFFKEVSPHNNTKLEMFAKIKRSQRT